MQLQAQDVARLLNVSQKTIYRWMTERHLPGHRIGHQYRFNRAELLEWANQHKVYCSPEILADESVAGGASPDFELGRALRAGGVFYGIEGGEVATVLWNMVGVLRLPKAVDRTFLHQLLLAREAMASTGIGEGVAIPHTRNPIVLHVEQPQITLCFLKTPVDFGALDGRPVRALFTLISPTVRAHLHLLSRLVFALRDKAFRNLVQHQGKAEEILKTLERLSQTLAAAKGKGSA